MQQSAYCRLNVRELTPYGEANGAQGRFFALRLERPAWTGWNPGQFLMLRPASFGLEIPWARPFGICDMTENCLTCFFQVLGRGTQRMARLKPGDEVSVWGPLGKGFALEPDTPTLLLAGGMGIVPFVGYVKNHPKPENVTVLFGHREPLNCYPADSIGERAQWESAQERAPEDRDRFLSRVRERMGECAGKNGLALACGPLPFLQTVRRFSQEIGARAQLSLENRMACGVGACLGCVAQRAGGASVCACREGPVFWADQIVV
ncbi:MAG: dihydroorotate dehydrogenase electron transfer subunit [Desulfovibrio sp.]|jgi:dihydroorotate dehydrogenase electron transfer subunit|nr:dihydroorotate dehydrogenase electron transfer subunit [Desulfovibrio sp.]